MTLKEITELAINNEDCVVLKVKDNHELDLIAFGCFSGDETMIRLTKGRTITCTLFKKNGSNFSWHWGADGFTLVTDQVRRMGQIIQRCIERDYGIQCEFLW